MKFVVNSHIPAGSFVCAKNYHLILATFTYIYSFTPETKTNKEIIKLEINGQTLKCKTLGKFLGAPYIY